MSTVKISQLPAITTLDTNTITTKLIALDSNTGVTGRITVQSLGQNLYSGDDVLSIGNNITFSDGTVQVSSPLATSVYANAAFSQANIAYTHASSAELYANGAFIESNAAFLQANTATSDAAGASLYANAAFLVANTPTHVANSAALYANGSFRQANAAFLHANSAFLVANTPTHVANSAALYANGSFRQANAAFVTANNALPNTTGTFAGTLNIAENLTVNGTFVMSNSNFSSTEAAVTIKATANVALPSNDGYMLHISGKQDVPSRIIFDSYGTNGEAYGLVAGRTARGNVDYPAAVQSGDVLMRITGNGYGSTQFAPLGIARIDIVATETYTDAQRGSQIKFYNIENGTNTLVNIATFNANNITFTGAVSPQKGFIYTPRLPQGNQTAITIDYETDSMIKANLTADLTISHQNFVAGKVVEVWLVNTGGTNRTVTHGCAALSSTTNSLTFTISATSCAHLKFFSIDGNLANTFVQVTNS
jgi:hypothetical protein